MEEAVTRLQPGKNYIYKPCQDQLNQWVKLKDKMTAMKGQIITNLDMLCVRNILEVEMKII